MLSLLFCVASFGSLPTRPFVVCLDPGHPSENGLGARSGKLREVELVWDVAVRMKAILVKGGIRVVMTKSYVGQKVTNRARAEIANRCKADLFLRIHADSGSRSGFTTYYPDGQARVHGVFGPPLAVIQRSKQDASIFHSATMQGLGSSLADLGCKSERLTMIGHRQGALTGTVFARVPVLLVEVCAVGSHHDEEFVASKSGREKLAEAMAQGVLAVQKASRR